MTMAIRGVVFDMDGVLVDAKEWHYEALNRALALFGAALPMAEHLARFDGRPTREKLRVLIEERRLPRGLANIVSELKQMYTLDAIYARCRPEFRTQLLVSQLKRRGLKVGVASNSIRQTVQLMMAKSALIDMMDVLLSNEDVTRAKPDPEIYRLAAQRLHVPPQDILVVEDHQVGAEAAAAAGCHVLKVAGAEETTLEVVMAHLDGAAGARA
jgi:HAD superfamily hydrolase (TIGR01509 family)